MWFVKERDQVGSSCWVENRKDPKEWTGLQKSRAWNNNKGKLKRLMDVQGGTTQDWDAGLSLRRLREVWRRTQVLGEGCELTSELGTQDAIIRIKWVRLQSKCPVHVEAARLQRRAWAGAGPSADAGADAGADASAAAAAAAAAKARMKRGVDGRERKGCGVFPVSNKELLVLARKDWCFFDRGA